MIVIIKSGHDTEEASRAVRVARDLTADIVLVQDAVYLGRKDALEGFCGTANALAEDVLMRGLADEIDKGVRLIDYGQLVDMLAAEDKVAGAF